MRRRRVLRAAGATLAGGVLGRSAVRRGSAQSADESTASEPLGSVAVSGAREAVVSADGETAYLALGDGYATVDVSDPTAPTVLAERRDRRADLPDGPLGLLNDVKVSGDRLVVVGPAHPGRELPHGVLVVDVAEPSDPAELGFYQTDFPIHNCEFDGRYCFLTGNGEDGNPLVIVDLEAMTEVGRWSLFDRDDGWASVRSGLRTVHDVTVVDGVAALAYWDAGTYLLDVADPADPTFLGAVDPGDPTDLTSAGPRAGVVPPGNHHYSLLAPGGDVLAVGRETWAVERDGEVLGGPSGVDLYDVSDPAAPAHLSRIDPPPTPDSTFAGTWTTAHNFDFRGETLYTAWYQGGVKRHDVSDPAAPVEETWWADPAATRFWTARLAVPGGHFVASSMGTRDGGDAGLWTFADAPGVGGDRSRFEATATTPTNATATTPTNATTTAASTPSPTPHPPSTPTDSPTPSSAAAPGFGALGAIASVAGVGALARRRSASDRDDDSPGDDAAE